MARTKKQTIDAASARKRQFQESLALNARQTEKLNSSCSETTSAKCDKLRSISGPQCDVKRDILSTMSFSSKTSEECNILPQAVVRIMDICKSPSSEIMDDECLRKASDISPRSKEAKNIFEQMEKCTHKKQSPKKDSPSKSKELDSSLKGLKSDSDKVKYERSRKLDGEGSSVKQNFSPKHGRRSPRHLSPNSICVSPPNKSPDNGGLEKQKINIFTDNIGIDLGKRVRSPRRLSEDMIALPIFSLRKVGHSPKEDAVNGVENSIDSPNNVFKSPNSASPSPNKRTFIKKMSSYKTCERSSPDTNSGNSKLYNVKHSNRNHKTKISTADKIKEECSVKEKTMDVSQTDSSGNMKENKILMSSICRKIMKEMTCERSDIFQRTVCEKKQKHSVDQDKKHKDLNLGNVNEKSMEIFQKGEFKKGVDKLVDEPGDTKPKSSEAEDVKPEVFEAVNLGGSEAEDLKPKESQLEDMKSKGSQVEDVKLKGSPADDMNSEGYRAEDVKSEGSQAEDVKSKGPQAEDVNSKGDEDQEGEGKADEAREKDSLKPSLLCAMLVGGTDVAHDYSQKRERYNPEVSEISDSETEPSRVVSPNLENSRSRERLPEEEKPQEKHEPSDGELLDKDCEMEPEVQSELATEQLCVSMEETDCKQIVENNSKDWKKNKIEFSSQLEKVNDDILTLLEIDVEDQFMEVPNIEEIIEETVSHSETNLFKVISQLGERLKENVNDPDDGDIAKIIKSCPKGFFKIVSSSYSERKWKNILERLDKGKLGLKIIQENVDNDMDNVEEKMDESISQSSRNKEINGSKDDDVDILLPELSDNKECEKRNPVVGVEKDCSSSSVTDEKPTEKTNGLISTSSSSLSGSLCDLDVDSMTVAVSQALNVSELSSCSGSTAESTAITSVSKCQNADSKKANGEVKRPFQKSKTCADLSLEYPSCSKSENLRRTNSSPQLKCDIPPSSNSPCLGKEQHNKSKLGGKIPVPGTSYSSKVVRKSWRKPRAIIDPKPLDVLTQFVRDQKEAIDIFTSQELQKYLWLPSNRMIVTPQIKKEISLADKTAEEAWAKRLQMMQEEDERQRKREEEIDLDYMKHEPDFDEVDGLLFMSFSTDTELLAHVRVEKALGWDQDDTMLRISRAKTFEETKALNGDMKGVKMKKLRGQHMRWKKYKKLYRNEVLSVAEAKALNVPLPQVKIPGKTSDASKLKRWNKKPSLVRYNVQDSKDNELNDGSFGIIDSEITIFSPTVNSTPEINNVQSDEDISELNKTDMSPKSKRRFNFSDRRAHKQLFKELKMDWEDRMIHRKLGGWSLKGNRPKKFSQAAKKRELKVIKQQGLQSEPETSFDTNPYKSSRNRPPDSEHDQQYYSLVGGRKKKFLFPLITEKMAQRCLKTLELSDNILKAVKRNKKRRKRLRKSSSSNIPFLSPIISPAVTSSCTGTPHSSVATAGSSLIMVASTPEASLSQCGSSVSTTTPALSLDMSEEAVMEGVEIMSQASSPSVTDTVSSPYVKTCSKPGCRYGCICHLCSINEVQPAHPSPVPKPSPRACDKEYCRLGCICESLDPEQPLPTQAHCRKPSCMLECHCATSAGGEENEDIPFLSSIKQRPRCGERFSNLPRREKTHRSAKNLDAITRKAMMLYETSEIYCEKVERAKKKSEFGFNSTVAYTTSPASSSSSLNLITQQVIPDKNSAYNIMSEHDTYPVARPMESTVFNAVNLVTSEMATVTASQFSPDRSQLFPWSSKRPYIEPKVEPKVDIDVNEVRLTRPIMEPSAHKRKRKSHPLSDEIFAVSSCARIQPYLWKMIHKTKKRKQMPETISETCSHLSFNQDDMDKEEIDMKITNVCSLACDNDSTNSLEKESSQQKDNPSCAILSQILPVKNTVLKLDTSQPLVSPPSGGVIKPIEAGYRDVNHGWHTSMVCLKARAAPKTQNVEDDVQEEDEVKLLEFAANCNWHKAKRDILSRVASCLTRGQYPQPKMMNINEFVVEILPKAKQPSLIPQALRANLPGQMYSIRVRITRRDDDSLLTGECEVIDLSEPSPLKNDERKTDYQTNQSDSIKIKKKLNEEFASVTTVGSSTLPHTLSSASQSELLSSTSSSSILTSSVVTTQSSLHSSIGISGFNHIYVGSNDSDNQPKNGQSKSAPGSRRSSIEAYKDNKLQFADDNFSSDASSLLVKPLDLDKVRILSKSLTSGSTLIAKSTTSSMSKQSLLSPGINSITVNSSKGTILVSHSSSKVSSLSSKQNNNSSSNMSTLHCTNPNKKISTTSLLNSGITPHSLSKEKPNLKIPNFPATSGIAVNPVIATNKVKEVKYVQMFYEVDGQKDKKKTLIAVPISLTGTNMDAKNNPTVSSMPILTVPMPVTQVKGLPLLAPRSKNKLHVLQAQPVIMKLPQITSSKNDSTSLKPLQVIPFSVSSLLSGNTTKSSSMSPISVSKIHLSSSSPLSVSDDAVKTCNQTLAASSLDQNPVSETTVTQSRDRPISSAEISLPSDFLIPKQTDSIGQVDGATEMNEKSSVAVNVDFETQKDSKLSQDDSKKPEDGHALLKTTYQSPNESVEYVESKMKICSHPPNKCAKESYLGEESLSSTMSAPSLTPHSVSSQPAPESSNLDLNILNEEKRPSLELIESCDIKQPFCDDNSGFEVVDMDDLYLVPDSLTTGEYVDVSSNNFKSSKEDVGVEHVLSGMKRKISEDIQIEDLDYQDQRSKKLKLYNDLAPFMDEDSNFSIVTASPQSYTSQAKSGLSSAMSSGSNDDVTVQLSSDEEIDVGQNIDNCPYMVEKAAWENDHSSMFCKIPFKRRPKGTSRTMREDSLRKVAEKDRIEYHNYLERNRRAKLKELFDNLAEVIFTVPGMQPGFHNKSTDSTQMPKATILSGAKATITHLNVKEKSNCLEIKELLHEKEKLVSQLEELKAELLTKNISGHTIAVILKKASQQSRRRAELANNLLGTGDYMMPSSSQMLYPPTEESATDNTQSSGSQVMVCKIDATSSDNVIPMVVMKAPSTQCGLNLPATSETESEGVMIKTEPLCLPGQAETFEMSIVKAESDHKPPSTVENLVCKTEPQNDYKVDFYPM